MHKDQIIEQIKEQINDFQAKVKTEKVGTVMEVGDGIARVSGLGEAMASEMLDFGHDVFGVALNLDKDSVGARRYG
jgi:F-type H+-transporting ATPase subunit alpha